MNRTERFYLIDQLLGDGAVVSRHKLLDELEVSLATLKRDLTYMRDRLNAPIIYDAEKGGYRFDTPDVGPRYELPGLWFNAEETSALLTMHQLIVNLEPGLLEKHLSALKTRLEMIVEEAGTPYGDVSRRIRLISSGHRRKKLVTFERLSRALLERKQIDIVHFNRSNASESDRRLSPQRLTYYKGNWYLEAWCHTREALRQFSVDAIRSMHVSQEIAKEIPVKTLDETYGGNYGIYGGKSKDEAILRFSVAASRWVSDEVWHEHQTGHLDTNGCYVLKVPYGNPTELLMDILRHGSDVEVIHPPEIRAEIAATLKRAARQYDD